MLFLLNEFLKDLSLKTNKIITIKNKMNINRNLISKILYLVRYMLLKQ